MLKNATERSVMGLLKSTLVLCVDIRSELSFAETKSDSIAMHWVVENYLRANKFSISLAVEVVVHAAIFSRSGNAIC